MWQYKQPVALHGEHRPLVDLFSHVDVLLTRDQYLLGLVFKELDVVVDVEDVFVELGKVVKLRKMGLLIIRIELKSFD